MEMEVKTNIFQLVISHHRDLMDNLQLQDHKGREASRNNKSIVQGLDLSHSTIVPKTTLIRYKNRWKLTGKESFLNLQTIL